VLWPPAYTIKKHARAKHVKLKASLHHGLEVVVPTRFNLKNIPEILEKHKSWIQKKLADFIEKPTTLPDEIKLTAINQTWRILYIQSTNKKAKLFVRPEQELVLLGNIEDKIFCKKLLTQWIRKQAAIYLTTCLQKIAQEMQLTYKKVVVRGQQSRWGSCSSDKSISLNYKLFFLPAELVRHVVIHELCHTVHLNHSINFWRMVASFDPQWKEHNRELRQSDRWVPAWLFAQIIA